MTCPYKATAPHAHMIKGTAGSYVKQFSSSPPRNITDGQGQAKQDSIHPLTYSFNNVPVQEDKSHSEEKRQSP